MGRHRKVRASPSLLLAVHIFQQTSPPSIGFRCQPCMCGSPHLKPVSRFGICVPGTLLIHQISLKVKLSKNKIYSQVYRKYWLPNPTLGLPYGQQIFFKTSDYDCKWPETNFDTFLNKHFLTNFAYYHEKEKVHFSAPS